MNIYLITEDHYGPLIYSKWIKYLNPSFRFINYITEFNANNIFIRSGGGQPSYFEVICNAIEDIKCNPNIDRLVIAVDSEDMTYLEKYQEINDYVLSQNLPKEKFRIIIQHFCLETWALANQFIIPRNPTNENCIDLIKFYNVLTDDAENLPGWGELNRSQFALRYLKVILKEKSPKLNYHKNNPWILLNRKYFERIKRRYDETDHIRSFNSLLNAFK